MLQVSGLPQTPRHAISLPTARRMHAHIVRKPHDASVTTKKIAELALVLSQSQKVSPREAAHIIFDAWLDQEPLITKADTQIPVRHTINSTNVHDSVAQ